MDELLYDAEQPICPTCGELVEVQTFEPEEPWQGTCAQGHTHTYRLVAQELMLLWGT